MMLHPSNPMFAIERPTSKLPPPKPTSMEHDIHEVAKAAAKRQELEDKVARQPGGPEAVMRFHKLRRTMKRIQK